MKDFLFITLAWLSTLPFIILTVAFAVFNQQSAPIVFLPFGTPFDIAVFVPVLAAIGLGFIYGSVMTWAAMGRQRSDARELKNRIKILEKQLEIEKAERTSAAPIPYIPPSGYLLL